MSSFTISAFGDEIDPDLGVQMNVLEKHDIWHIELRGVNGKGLVTYSVAEVREFKKQMADRGFGVSAIGSPLGKISITDDFAPHLDLFKHTLEIAHIMDTAAIRMFSFFIPNGQTPEQYRDEVMDRWRAFVEAAEGSGLMLLHENEKEIYGDTPERCLDLLETVSADSCKAIFDPANFVQCDVETYPHAFSMLRDHVRYMHIKDAERSDRQVVPAGYGDGKIKEILTELHASGFEGFLSLEPHLGHFQGLASLERDMATQDMPDSGPGKFAIAANALKAIIDQIQ